jgi:hypothetical protein
LVYNSGGRPAELSAIPIAPTRATGGGVVDDVP